jgi:hypothetical protein
MLKILWKTLFPSYSNKQYDTVRYAFPLVVIAALFAGLATVVTQSSSYVTIRTDAKTIAANEQFYIEVLATANTPVNAINLVLSYPDTRMVVDGIDTGTSVITLWTEKPYAKDGNIYIQGGTFRKGFMGEHVIVRIKAHAVASGETRVIIKESQLVAGDGKGSPVETTVSSEFNEARILVTDTGSEIVGKATVSIVTDTNGDGKVDLTDISKFMSAWFTKGATYDFNGDGRMTLSDFSILLSDSFTL